MLNEIAEKRQDPRDSLQKASRYELCELAKAYGITEIGYGKDGQTLEDMIKILHQRGIHSIQIPERNLGYWASTPILDREKIGLPQTKAVEKPVEAKPVSEMNMTEMRSECKRRGIKMARTDNLNTLREKLSA